MSKILSFRLIKRCTSSQYYGIHFTVKRGILSEAYLCDETWQKRLESPYFRDLKMDQYFVETDKKFGTKKLVSGVDIDLFANNVQDESQLDELEHLLYRFRRTKRASEMMDSTNYAVIRTFLKFRQYESLFRILNNCENYGVFPDLYSYNILMSTFLKEKMFKEAAQSAILMMLQEDFRNQISCVLGIYSCQMFLDECPLSSLSEEKMDEPESVETKDDDEEEETLVRVPFLRNHWFDDHFNITNPKHLIGKTFYLLGREMDNILGRSYRIVGLAMYEKWDKLNALLNSFSETKDCSLLNDAVEKVQSLLNEIPEDEEKTKEKWLNQCDKLIQKMKSENQIKDGDLKVSLETELKQALQFQKDDIEAQKRLFSEWGHQRKLALEKQSAELDKERRLKVIEEKKEYLFWKEKLLFFFENENKNLEEVKKIEEFNATTKKLISVEDSYVVPEIVKTPTERSSKYKKLARVKKL